MLDQEFFWDSVRLIMVPYCVLSGKQFLVSLEKVIIHKSSPDIQVQEDDIADLYRKIDKKKFRSLIC